MAIDSPIKIRLKEARLRAGLTQEKLGILAGIDENNASAKMNQYEKGTHIPKYPRLKDLADALGVPSAYFYAETDELAELIYCYGKLNSKAKQKLLKNAQP
ncbi:MAG: helix-turn-helix transcriptional regulator [Ectothiorhodospiraceae bacterium]|nr:helix-turn-helix transcriptional regulator [Ectothiorhodospiraceae bacterium]